MRRSLLPAVSLLALALLVSACGSGGALSLDPVASAATKAQEAGTYRYDFDAKIAVLGYELSFTGNGVSDTEHGAAQMTMHFAGLPAAMTKYGSTAEAVVLDKVMYLQMPFLSGQLPDGKTWLKLDLGRAARARGFDLSSFGQVDPQQSLQQLLASGDTQKVGAETVQGEQMTRYRSTIDPVNVASVPADRRDAAKAALKQLGVTKIPVDVWVDGQGRLRRETFSLQLDKLGSSLTMSMDLSDFGIAAAITAPPADQVLDGTKLSLRG